MQIVFLRVRGAIPRELSKNAIGTLPSLGFPLGQTDLRGPLFPLAQVNADVDLSTALGGFIWFQLCQAGKFGIGGKQNFEGLTTLTWK